MIADPKGSAGGGEVPVTVIAPRRSFIGDDLLEIFAYRDFLYVLIWRDLKIRYKQTVVGFAWVWFQPLAMMAVYSLFFGYLARFPSGQFPYPLFVLSGIIPWMFLSRAISDASTGLVENRSLLTRLYFPRIILPVSSVVVSLVDFAVALVLLFIAMALAGHVPGVQFVFLPFFIFELFLLAIGLAVLTSALNALYRDFSYIVPLFLQIWMFSSPVIYATDLVPAAYRPFYALNPLVGILEGIRWSLGGGPWPHMLSDQAVCLAIISVVLIASIAYFRKIEKTLVDTL